MNLNKDLVAASATPRVLAIRAARERWQLACLPIYCGWAALVVVAFPPMFSFQ